MAYGKTNADADKLKKEINELISLSKKAAAEVTEAFGAASAAAVKVGSDFETSVSKTAAGGPKFAAASEMMTDTVLTVNALTAASAANESAAVRANKAAAEGAKYYSEQLDAADKLAASGGELQKNTQLLFGGQSVNFSRLSDLKNCLDDSGIDSEGKITGNYESVKKIVSMINEMYPEEITIVNGKIQNYKNLSESIDSYIEKLREEALAESKKNNAPLKNTLTAEKDKSKKENADDFYEVGKQAAEKEKQLFKDKWNGINRLEQIGLLNEEDALKERRTLFNKYFSGFDPKKDYLSEGFNYYKQIYDDETALTETSAQKEKQLFKDKWNGINQLEQIGLLNEEDALKERRTLFNEYFSGFDPKKDYLSEGFNYYKQIYDDETALTKEALKEQEEIVDGGLSDILKRYQNAYSELEKKRENYRKKLLSIGGDIFSVEETENKNGKKTKTYTVNDIDEQIKKMKEYHAQIKKLKEQNISDSLFEELASMDNDDSMQFTKYLSEMSGAEFKKINDLYKEKDTVAKELSEDLYKSEAQNISDSMTEALVDLAVSAYDYGAQTAEQFSAGFNDAVDKLGIDALYGQYQAAGATKIYENYASVSKDDREFFITVDVTGKSNVYLDSTVVGTLVTNQQAKQKAKTGG